MNFWQTHRQGDEGGEGSRLVASYSLQLAWTPVFCTAQLMCRGLGSNMANVATDSGGTLPWNWNWAPLQLSGVRVPTSMLCDPPYKAGYWKVCVLSIC